jgi:D-alanyl-D-alanine carboxypeptidase
LFRVGSISKPITAIAIAKFLERGQLRIGQKISEIPNLNWQGDVTIRDLLKHTSGIANVENPRYANSFKNVTDADDLHARILSMRSFGKSGSAYSYSSTNFLLLGIIVEKLSGSYRDFVKETVFDPAGAIRSGFDFPSGPLGDGYAAPEGNPNGPRESNNFPFSAGAFVTSINELLKIDQAMKQGKIIDVRNLSNLMRNNMGFMQFGAMYFHPGVIDSYHAAWFTSLPEERNNAIFVFSNSRKSRMVSREIAQQLKAQYGL